MVYFQLYQAFLGSIEKLNVFFPNINYNITTKLFENLFSELLLRKKLLILFRSFSLYYRPFFFTLDKFFYPINLVNESTLGVISPIKFGYYLFSR